jgi:transposase
VVRNDYELTWMKPKIDLRELAKLLESGMSLPEIIDYLGVTKSTLYRTVQRMK